MAKKARAKKQPSCWTLSVPQAGALYFNIGRNAAYRAAERGQIPTIRVGNLLRVPVAQIERLLAGEPVLAGKGT
jgi:Helix-turn-helix domain